MGFALAWHLLAADSPKQCWYISSAELDYLQKYVGQSKPKSKPAQGPKPKPVAGAVAAGEGGVWRVLGLPRRVALNPGASGHLQPSPHPTPTDLNSQHSSDQT